jgi:DNA modification methylase
MSDAPHPTGLHSWSGHTAAEVPWELHRGDAAQVLAGLGKDRFQCAVTSPPYYWQRDYKVQGQLGLEATIQEYVDNLVKVFQALRPSLKTDGLLFLNLGDTYYSAKGMPKGDDKKNKARRFGLRAVDGPGLGVPRKTTIGIPWRVALAMIADGWVLRSPIIWQRPAPLPEPSSKDRPWRTYETIFMFARMPRYRFNRAALGGDEDIWRIGNRPQSSKGLHSAAFPEELALRCIEIATTIGDEVIDPFAGTGTTLAAALRNGRSAVGIDLAPAYCEFAANRLAQL